MPVGATHCLDCGWSQVQSEGVGGEQPILCINPACGVANPPGERYCQRCNSLLPTAAGTMLQGRYQIEALVAEGGFGRVYKGKDVQTRQPVAIKDMICLDPAEFSIRLNFFRREAEILRELAGLEIVPKIFDFIQQGQSAHLIMEFIPGDTLQKILENNNNRPFPADLVIEWGIKICRVLEVMHSRTPPIIHRDLKPDNIMLLEDGRSIKLIDFGTARDLTHSFKGRNPGLTRVYTEGYAPPEQIVGKPEARSDLFALAATMYHLVTGKAPEGFYAARELETRLKDANGNIPTDQRWLFELLRINLAESVNDRYYSAAEIRRDLEQRRLTTQVVCPKCQHVNRVREPYCGRCAAVLTQPGSPCQQCGKTNPLGSRFCIHCAHRLG
jgi:serine/threonine-protein kinase